MTDKQVLAKAARRPKTAVELGGDRKQITNLVNSGQLVRAGTQRNGGRGRPAVLYQKAA